MHNATDIMKKFSLRLLSIALLFGISCMEEEEPPREITISWTFISSVTSEPIAGVRFSGTTSNERSFRGTSNGSGEGTFTFDGTGTIRIEIQATHQSFGEDSFTITVGAGETSGERTFSMTPSFEVTVDRTSLNFGSTTRQLDVTITNEGTIPINFSVNSETPEITITPSSGVIASNRSVSLSISLDRTGFEPGEHSGNVSIAIDELNSNLGFTYRFKVLSPDELNWVDEDADGLIDIRNIDDLYRLSLEADRDTFANVLGFELLRDLDFDKASDYKTEVLQEQLTSGEGWLPIALSSRYNYDKVFEGNGFVIRNLFMDRAADLAAFIATTSQEAVVQNLRIELKSITGRRYTAGLIGWNRGIVQNCSVFGRIISGSESSLLVGSHSEGLIESCYSGGSIVSDGSNIGGITGSIAHVRNVEAAIRFSYSNASIFGTGCVGGLVGCRVRGIANITSCYATGNITATGRDIGGLAGGGSMTLTSCYARGEVSSESSEVGGLIGTAGTVLTSFSTGRVRGTFRVGGLAGVSGNITGSNYWDTTTSGTTRSAGQATGLSTIELQGQTTANGIYITWDPEVWDFGTASQYPALKGMPNGLEAQRQ